MVLFDDIHRNVVAKIGDKRGGLPFEPFWFTDVTKAINQAIAKTREGYTRNGRGDVFSKTAMLYVSLPDLAYPHLHYTNLTEFGPVMSTVDPAISILSSNVLNTDVELTTDAVSYPKGARVFRFDDNMVYEAVELVPAENTYDLVFDPNHVRTWYKNNGIKYKVGDVVSSEGSYYVCGQAHRNEDMPEDITLVELNSVPAWNKVYWKRVGDNNKTAVYFPFWQLTNLRLHKEPRQLCAFSIVRDKLYMPKEYNKITITYVPEWTYVSDLSATIDLPYELVPEVETLAMQFLAPVIGFSMESADEQSG